MIYLFTCVMMHYEDGNVNVILIYHDLFYNAHDDQQFVVVVDNDDLFLLIDHVVEMNFDVIHVEYVRFFHQLFHVLMDVYDPIHHVRIHLDENDVVDDDLDFLVMMIVIENGDVLNVLAMENIIHNNQDMCSLNMVEHDDVQYVEPVVQLQNKQK
jgi:hypothetical protein